MKRRKAREDALQILYQLDMNHDLTTESGMAHFKALFLKNKSMDGFTERLVRGVSEHLTSIDDTLAKASEHWRTDRMSVVDRNVLRLGVYELHHCDDIPATVTINELVEVSKHFGSENTASFVNGVLDRLKRELNNPQKAP